MSRITTISSIDAAPEAAKPLLQKVKANFGMAPNLFMVIANSPSALKGALSLGRALSKGSLDYKTRERIAVAVAAINGCDYCLSAHTFAARRVAKLDEAEIAANRNGASNEAKADAAVKLAARIVRSRGHVSDADVASVKAAGYDDAQIVEIVMHVVLNTMTNYINVVANTEIDFPIVDAHGMPTAFAGQTI